jgi:SAM-dependent methyltransferase
MKNSMRAFGLLVLAIIVLLGRSARTSEPTKAKQILDSTDVKGGLVVHVGCGNGELTTALRAEAGYVVLGLDTDAHNVTQARRNVRLKGFAGGQVTIDRFDGRRLPLIDNLANLVVAEDLGDVSIEEVTRVLCPNGVAYIHRDGQWQKTIKPRPAAIDDWSHFLHGPDGNAVAQDDVVGFPHHIQ